MTVSAMKELANLRKCEELMAAACTDAGKAKDYSIPLAEVCKAIGYLVLIENSRQTEAGRGPP